MITRINDVLAESRLKREENEKGFTLIELLVVVIIIGILAAIAIPVFLNQRESAWKSSVESDLKNAATVIETAAASNNGVFPASLAGTYTDTPPAAGGTAPAHDFKVSADNQIIVTIVGGATGGNGGTSYQIVGSNDNITTQTLTYDSAAGGLGDWK